MTQADHPDGFVVRAARPNDAPAMADVLAAIIAVTGQARPHDTAFVQARYIDHPDQRACFVAVDSADRVLGFQALKYASFDKEPLNNLSRSRRVFARGWQGKVSVACSLHGSEA